MTRRAADSARIKAARIPYRTVLASIRQIRIAERKIFIYTGGVPLCVNHGRMRL